MNSQTVNFKNAQHHLQKLKSQWYTASNGQEWLKLKQKHTRRDTEKKKTQLWDCKMIVISVVPPIYDKRNQNYLHIKSIYELSKLFPIC